MMSLLSVGPGTIVRIAEVVGGEGVRRRLFSLGFHIGDRVELAGAGILKGPVLIRHLDSGVTVAVGRGIAQRILVEP